MSRHDRGRRAFLWFLVGAAWAVLVPGCQTGDPRLVHATTRASPKAPLPPPGDTYKVIGYQDGLNYPVIRYTPKIYRGGAVTRQVGLDSLEQLGIKTIISVTPTTSELNGARQRGFVLVELPFEETKLTDQVLDRFLRTVDRGEPPIYVHCCGCEGGPRSAALMACYRMQREGWSYEKAAAEFARLGGDPKRNQALLAVVRNYRPTPGG